MVIIFIFILGAAVGSGLAALLARLKNGERWSAGRSHCPHCRRTLAVGELVPLLSWIILRGRCRGCRRRISGSYPVIELVTAILFTAGYLLRLGAGGAETFLAQPLPTMLLLGRDFFAIAVLIVVFIFDLTEGLILDRVTLPAMVILGLCSLLLGRPFSSVLLGAALGGGFFGAQYLISRGRWIGGGDIRLGALLGALLGPASLIVALLLAYVSGALVAVYLVVRGQKSWRSTIPFGTFLSVGGLLALYFGDAVTRWYVGP